ncbi:MAG: hypothetical protein Q9159_003404 [Coniocarpon cinnabarinum]
MAYNFDDLLDHLIDCVAISGNFGTTFENIPTYVQSYRGHAADTGNSDGLSTPDLDESALRTVWRWLVECPDFAVRRRDPSTVWRGAAEVDNGERGASPRAALIASHFPHGLIIFPSEESMWQSLAGHGPDYKRVPALMFQLLSIIAACREQGIQQPDLVRRSRQDKRSVPSRTDKLHQAGYIVKRGIVETSRHTLTSHCLLKKFVKPEDSEAVKSWAALDPRAVRHKLFKNDTTVDLPMFLDFILAVSRDRDHVPASELRERLDAVSRRRIRTLLLKVLRKMANIGLIEIGQMLVSSEPKATYVPCIQFVRDPTEAERVNFGRIGQSVENPDQDQDSIDDERQGMDVEEDDDEAVIHAIDAGKGDPGVGLWRSSSLIQNEAFDFFHDAGPSGTTTVTCAERMGWQFYAKPFEILLQRLTEWKAAQPIPLLHLGIIKESKIDGRTREYILRSPPNMQEAVAKGGAKWDAGKRPSKPSSSASTGTDAWGFPALDERVFVGVTRRGPAMKQLKKAGSTPRSFTPISKIELLDRKRPSALSTKPDSAVTSPPDRATKRRKTASLTHHEIVDTGPSQPEPELVAGSTSPPSGLPDGIYLNPPGSVPRRKIRGRPPKHVKNPKVIVFKSQQLKDLAWFNQNTSPLRFGAHDAGPTIDGRANNTVQSVESPAQMRNALTGTQTANLSSLGTAVTSPPPSASLAQLRSDVDSAAPSHDPPPRYEQRPQTNNDEFGNLSQSTMRKIMEDADAMQIDKEASTAASNQPTMNSPSAGFMHMEPQEVQTAQFEGSTAQSLTLPSGNTAEEQQDSTKRMCEATGALYRASPPPNMEQVRSIQRLPDSSAHDVEHIDQDGPPSSSQQEESGLFHVQAGDSRCQRMSQPQEAGSQLKAGRVPPVPLSVTVSTTTGHDSPSEFQEGSDVASIQTTVSNLLGTSTQDDPATAKLLRDERCAMILEILSHTGGVYPMSKEFWWALASLVRRKKGRKAAVADQTTLYRLIRNLCDAGVLRITMFDHRTKSHTTLQLKIVMFRTLGDDDPKVEKLKRNMHTVYPDAYFPEGFVIEEDLEQRAGRHLYSLAPWKKSKRGELLWSKVLQPRSTNSLAPVHDQHNNEQLNENKGAEDAVMSDGGSDEYDNVTLQKRNKAQIGASAKRRKTASNALQSDSRAESLQMSSLDKTAKVNARRFFLNKLRALTNPLPVLHGPSGTFGSIYELRVRQRPITQMRIDTTAPAQFEAQMPLNFEDMVIAPSGEAGAVSRDASKNEHDYIMQNIDAATRWELDNETLLTSNKQLAVPRFMNLVGGYSSGPVSTTFFNVFEDYQRPEPSAHSVSAKKYRELAHGSTMPQEQSNILSKATNPAARFKGKYSRLRRPGCGPAPSRVTEQASSYSQSNSRPEADCAHPVTPRTEKQEAHRHSFEPTPSWTEAEIGRMIIIVVAIRTLCGGKRKSIDWTLVNKYINFDLKEHLSPAAAWRKIQIARREQVLTMEEKFPEAYLNAYANDNVAGVNFDDLSATNWEAIFSWSRQLYHEVQANNPGPARQVRGPGVVVEAKNASDNSSDHISLPSTRTHLEQKFRFDSEDSPLDTSLLFDPRAHDLKLRMAQINLPFEMPLSHKSQACAEITEQCPEMIDETTITQTLLRACENSDDGGEFFNAEGRHLFNLEKSAFKDISKETIVKALKGYVRDGVIKLGSSDWQHSMVALNHMNTLLRKSITLGSSDRFQSCMKYKRELDRTMSQKQVNDLPTVHLDHTSEEAATLTVLNLAALGMVRLSLNIPPLSTTHNGPLKTSSRLDGLSGARLAETFSLWGAQLTNNRSAKVDTNGLNFAVVVKSTERYESDLPPIDNYDWKPPTRHEQGSLQRAVPIWCDLKRTVLDRVWKTVVVSLVCWLVSRPLSSARDIAKSWGTASSIQPWEVELALSWLEAREITKRSSGGRWRLGAYWWCILGETGWQFGTRKEASPELSNTIDEQT